MDDETCKQKAREAGGAAVKEWESKGKPLLAWASILGRMRRI